jgi:hypothetical protein
MHAIVATSAARNARAPKLLAIVNCGIWCGSCGKYQPTRDPQHRDSTRYTHRSPDIPHGLELLDVDLYGYFRSILSGEQATVDHHWPYCRQRRSPEEVRLLPRFPLTIFEHSEAHGSKPPVERFMELAPPFWEEIGLWGIYGPPYETWLARREYLASVT